ncbi:MAG: hypothetical protein GY867_00045, partial [bacterium]|nr:hypothetical protein [bacterium]
MRDHRAMPVGGRSCLAVATVMVLLGLAGGAAAGPDTRAVQYRLGSGGDLEPGQDVFGFEPDPADPAGQLLVVRQPAPQPGFLHVDPEPVDDRRGFRVRARFQVDQNEALIGLAVVNPKHGSYIAGLTAADHGSELTLTRSTGQWSALVTGSSFAPAVGQWFLLEIEVVRWKGERHWRVFAWPQGDQRPAKPIITARESYFAAVDELAPAIWSAGDGLRRAADLTTESLVSSRGFAVGTWPIELVDDAVQFNTAVIASSDQTAKKGRDLRTLRLRDVDSAAKSAAPPADTKIKSSFSCNPY